MNSWQKRSTTQCLRITYCKNKTKQKNRLPLDLYAQTMGIKCKQKSMDNKSFIENF